MKVYSPSIIEGLIVSGSATISGSLFVEGTISASGLTGNIENALTASYVQLEDVDGFTDYSASVRTSVESISASISDDILDLQGQDQIFNNYTSSTDLRLSSIETESGSIRTTLNNYTSSADSRLGSLETESGSIRTEFNNYTSSISTAISVDGTNVTTNGNLTITGDLLVEGTQSIFNTETFVVEDNIIELNTAGAIKGGILVGDITAPSELSGSLLWDGANDHWVAGISGSEERIVLESEFTSYTASTDLRVDALETESGSIRTTLNNYTSSADLRLDSLETESGSIRTTLNNYTSSADLRIDSLETESGSIRTDFSNYTSSADLRLGSLEAESGSIRTDFNNYTSSTDTRIGDLENFSSSLDATFATDAELESATSSIITTFNSYTSSTDLRLDSLETESGSIRTDFSNYTSSADLQLGSLETESGSIRADFSNYTSSTDSRLSSIETESGSIRSDFNNYTSSADIRLGSLETESGSIRTTLNNYTSSTDSRLSSIETESGSIRTDFNSYTSSADLRLGALEIESGSIRTDFSNYTSSADLRFGALETESGSIRTAFNTFTGSSGVVSASSQIDHNTTTNYVVNEHIDHSTINITAGSGISGGGDITTSRTLTLDTGSTHFTSGVKTKLDADLVVSGSDVQVKTFLSLENVDNTADADKPLSTAQKAYVDEVAQGLKARTAALVLVDTDLNATYDNGVNGSGSFLESNTNGAFPTTDDIDSTLLNLVGIRILVIGQTNKEENGLYVVQTPGNGSTPWKIRRADAVDSDEEIPGSFIFVKSGTVYANTGWILLVDNPVTFTIGTDDINPTQFSGAGSFLAGDGLDLDGNTFSLDTGSVHFNTGVKNKLNTDLVVSSSAQIIAALPAGTISGSGQVDHNATTNYVANQHIDHSTVNISAGSGLTGGGNITATRTLTLDTGSAHFTGGVKTKMNADGVVSGSGQIAINSTTGTLNVNKGGTGQTSYTNGQLLIGNTTGNTLVKATLTAGTGISITNGAGSISIAATNNGTVTSIATGNGITGGTITSTGTLGLDGQALALHNLATNGVIARTGAGTVAGRTITGTANRVTITNGDGVSGNPTITAPQDLHTGASFQVGGLGVGTAASGSGNINATGEITAYFSDARLKNFYGNIPNALSKVMQLGGYYFTENELAKSLGYDNDKMQVGLNAQEVQSVLPEVVAGAPISNEYLTVKYEKLIPLLIEAIKEQQNQIEELKNKLDNK